MLMKRNVMIALNCPKCGNEQVQKVSAIVDEGITEGSYESREPYQLDGKTYYFLTKRAINSTTGLAKKVAQPPLPKGAEKPMDTISGCGVYLGVMVLVFIGSIVGVMIFGMYSPWVTFFVIPPMAILFIPDKKARERKKRDYSLYDIRLRTLVKWSELFYCHRCASVFVPGQSEHAPVEQMKDFIGYPD
jgi:hypothetical protein